MPEQVTQQEELFTEEDKRIFFAFQRSKVWRRFCDALCQRREHLFAHEPKNSDDLWQTRGAIREVNHLLHNGPKLIVQYERWRRAGAIAPSAATYATSDAETSEIPQGPATFEG